MRREKSITWVSRISIVVIVLLLGCSKDNPQPVAIPGDFSEYINRFATEGKARNVAVDISKLTIEFVKQVTSMEVLTADNRWEGVLHMFRSRKRVDAGSIRQI